MTKEIKIGRVAIGGGNRVAIQSMTNTKTEDIDGTVRQINALCDRGCDIVRCAVNNIESAVALKEIKKQISIPLVADIHFDYMLALAAIKNGADKVRINPGNLGEAGIKKIIAAAKDLDIPIRIGVNGGSLEKDIFKKSGYSEDALLQSALRQIDFFERQGFDKIVLSVKSSDVPMTVKGYRLLSKRTAYPLHLGVTEAGTKNLGIVKSSIGIGALLIDGIGDTVRVSLSGDPSTEIEAAKNILKSLGLIKNFVEVIACPTCGRTEIDIEKIAGEIEAYANNLVPKRHIKIAVMGCVVNGIGEAGGCDIGVAGGKEKSALFKDGKIFKTIPNGDITPNIKKILSEMINE
jgi:(E)-4-hydroxy-3-methylbut-2-enyl-diphosphate synthase